VVSALRNTRKLSALLLRSAAGSDEVVLELVSEPATGALGRGRLGSGAATHGTGSSYSYSNVRRVHRFRVLQAADILNATFNYPPEQVRYVSAGAALLHGSLKHLYGSAEISCSFLSHGIRFRSYHADSGGAAGAGAMSTEVAVHYSDVNEYSVFSQSQQSQGQGQQVVEMVFCVKEVGDSCAHPPD
jgi:hypothetical protein